MFLSKILAWITKHIWQTILIGLGLFFVPLIFVHIAYRIPAISPWFATTWFPGDLISYIAGFLAFLGSLGLGALALYQNEKANKLSDRIQKSQELRDKFDRTPCVSIIGCNGRYGQKFDGFTRLHGAYFDQTESAPEGLSLSDKILQLEVGIVNSSKVYASVIIDKIEITCDDSIIFELTYQKHLSGYNLDIILLDAAEESTLHIALPPKVFLDGIDTKGNIYLTISNSIGEQYQKSFSVIFTGDNTHSVKFIRRS